MKTVVILNAPPFAGKDTLADLMVETMFASKKEFKTELYKATAEFFNLPLATTIEACTDRSGKDKASCLFKLGGVNLSPREALIHTSEAVYKLRFGEDYFGKEAAKSLQPGLNVFSDGGGWWNELAPVVQESHKVLICRLHRKGFNFDNDSRNYYDETTIPLNLTTKVKIVDLDLVENQPEQTLKQIGDILDYRQKLSQIAFIKIIE